MLQLSGDVIIYLADQKPKTIKILQPIQDTNNKKTACLMLQRILKKDFPNATRFDTSRLKAAKIISSNKRYKNGRHRRRR